MTTIYLVSAGSYSDYHVVALFSEKEKADHLASQEDGRVEEYSVDDPKWKDQIINYRATDRGWICSLEFIGEGRHRGSTLPRENFRIHQEGLGYCIREGEQFHFNDYAEFNDQDYWRGSWDLSAYVIAETKEKATKIAMERFGAFIEQRSKEGKPLPRGKND